MIVFCTVPDEATAKEIARTIVKEGLCACVNQIPKIKSYYIYEGEFCEDDELLLLIKTASSHFKALEKRLKKLHPYDTPEIIATSITESSVEYRDWMLKTLSLDI
ncbi:divalent-cation tolerance protein CutA [Campylobacterota bacterium]